MSKQWSWPFGPILDRTWRLEGFYSDDPDDPGGSTNWGITRVTLAAWRKRPVTKAEARCLTQDEAAEIYHERYWRRLHCHKLPAPVAACVFDAAVNQGPKRAGLFLQKALNRLGARLAVDGVIGPRTEAALASARPLDVVVWMTAYRLLHYSGLRHFWKYGLGWARRAVLVACHAARLEGEPTAVSNSGAR